MVLWDITGAPNEDLVDVLVVGLLLRLAERGTFSAVNFGLKRFLALVKPVPNPSLRVFESLKRLYGDLSSCKRESGEGGWGEDENGVGDRAKTLGGEDDMIVIVCMLRSGRSH